jgi:7,8-dihydropterin-6-yl-methyl-4-(beta-D-ribofuranosyl)aminobenzene 5'-phosphate synthase
MKLSILVNNNTIIDRYFLGEPGLSILIEDTYGKVLFDTGYSDAFLINAGKLNISLLDLKYVVISHGHFDHTWGLASLIRLYTEARIENITFNKPILIAHPYAFKTKSFDPLAQIGSIIAIEDLKAQFKVKFTKEPFWLTKNLVFLGEIPRVNKFENKIPVGFTEIDGRKEDFLLDDSALVYKSSKGIVIVTGCSHAGICNIVEYAKEITKDSHILDIIGGFHLLNADNILMSETLKYLKLQKIKQMHPCHCTDLKAKIELSAISNIGEVGSGLSMKY